MDGKSPLYTVSRDVFNKLDWEVVVVLEGIVEATGCTVQARTSYLLSEISWGYDFVDVVSALEKINISFFCTALVNNIL